VVLPVEDAQPKVRPRIRKKERRRQILLELKLRPHIRIAELADRFGVSSETVRRDFEALSGDGLLDRAHGGAWAPAGGRYPGLDERSRDRLEERERIGRLAATLVRPGETVMVDSGTTTLQMARYLALEGTACLVLTNSLPVAMALGQSDGAEVTLCPGDYVPDEAAVIGPDTIGFLQRHHVDRCLIGASALSEDGPSEAVRGFAAVKRAMLASSADAHLLIDSEKFARRGLAQIGALAALTSIVVDAPPEGALRQSLDRNGVQVMVA